jgi:hypothetical protein
MVSLFRGNSLLAKGSVLAGFASTTRKRFAPGSMAQDDKRPLSGQPGKPSTAEVWVLQRKDEDLRLNRE